MANSNDVTGREPAPDILLVDDDHPTLLALGQDLREAGFSVRVATTGSDALRHCDELAPELAMLGTRLPDMPGWEVAADLRERSIPFIFLTTPVEEEVVQQSIELGAYSYLYKPLNTGQIVPVIKAALNRGQDAAQPATRKASAASSTYTARETSVAIGVLMERHRLTADEAFEALRRYARSQRRKMHEVAAQVIRATEEVNIPVKPTGSRSQSAPDKSRK